MEAHLTIYRDRLNGQQSEAGIRQRCTRMTLASFFRCRRFSVRDDIHEEGGLKTTLFNPFAPGYSIVYIQMYLFFISTSHQNIPFFKNGDGRFKFSLKEKRKYSLTLMLAFIQPFIFHDYK